MTGSAQAQRKMQSMIGKQYKRFMAMPLLSGLKDLSFKL